MKRKVPIKVLVAKLGLDGHDRGAKVVAKMLMEAGMEVIYTGRHQTPSQVVNAAIEEDVDVIGISLLSGAHLFYTERLMRLLKERGADDIMVVIGGNIPESDAEKLRHMGVRAIFPSYTPFQNMIRWLEESVPER